MVTFTSHIRTDLFQATRDSLHQCIVLYIQLAMHLLVNAQTQLSSVVVTIQEDCSEKETI